MDEKRQNSLNNLIPSNKRTPSERREIARKAGIKSGEVRRAKKTFRTLFEDFGEMKITDEGLKEGLKKAGIEEEEMVNKVAIAFSMYLKAISGDTRAFELIRDTMGEKPSDKIDLVDDRKNTKLDKILEQLDEQEQ